MKNLIFGLLLTVIVSACGQKTKTVPSIAGTYNITYIKDTEGEIAKEGEVIVCDLIAKDNHDSTRFDLDPFVIRKDTAKWASGSAGLYEIFYDVTVGDSLKTTLEINDFFTNTAQSPLPPWVAADSVSDLTFYIRVDTILDFAALQDYMNYRDELTIREEMGDAYVSPEEQPAKDDQLITQYLAENGIEAQKDESGIYYVITQEGEGENATSGNNVLVNYAGYLLDGTYFDTSWEEIAKEQGLYDERRDYQPFNFTIDTPSVIEGWQIGFKKLNKGAKATLFIPSDLAYGRRSPSPKIPGSSVLVFDVEVVDIK